MCEIKHEDNYFKVCVLCVDTNGILISLNVEAVK